MNRLATQRQHYLYTLSFPTDAHVLIIITMWPLSVAELSNVRVRLAEAKESSELHSFVLVKAT